MHVCIFWRSGMSNIQLFWANSDLFLPIRYHQNLLRTFPSQDHLHGDDLSSPVMPRGGSHAGVSSCLQNAAEDYFRHHAVAALRGFTLVHAVSAARRQVAADLWTKPIGLNHKPACRLPVNYIHHRHFIITQPKADTHFTIPRRIEGWVDLVGWLHTEMVYPLTDGHPSKY